jgi:hypothetical protein
MQVNLRRENLFWGGSTRVWTQCLTLARQALYHLHHSISSEKILLSRQVWFFSFFFLVVLGFALRAWYLLGRCSTLEPCLQLKTWSWEIHTHTHTHTHTRTLLFSGSGIWSQGPPLDRQALYYFSQCHQPLTCQIKLRKDKRLLRYLEKDCCT